MIPALIPSSQKPIVIDTNVCLDLFVFRDPRWAGLLAALESGAVEAVTRADCRDEYLHVLHYPHLPLDEGTRPDAAARFDDQKFLEIARDAGAAILVTKDKALLKLGKKTARENLFLIMQPEAWIKLAATP
jgi:predicted nucleic acid-binding protein